MPLIIVRHSFSRLIYNFKSSLRRLANTRGLFNFTQSAFSMQSNYVHHHVHVRTVVWVFRTRTLLKHVSVGNRLPEHTYMIIKFMLIFSFTLSPYGIEGLLRVLLVLDYFAYRRSDPRPAPVTNPLLEQYIQSMECNVTGVQALRCSTLRMRVIYKRSGKLHYK
jgi:hypothetical protein